ncbi:OprD family outer membrane porin [Pseudomonas sp. 32A]|uniref:OprD family outer membrane porin n=1 Tax=Pseudomonas sp. 32A TaxID=651185 RepID=UPI004045F18F
MFSKSIFSVATQMAAVAVFAWAPASRASEQSDSGGLIADSHLNAITRTLLERQSGDSANYRDWSQGLLINYISGFTQGLIGFGFDAQVDTAVKLDGGRGHAGSVSVPMDSNGDPQSTWAKSGGSVKMRVSNTTIRYGDAEPTTPVLAVGNSYQLDQTVRGWMIDSNEFGDLALKAGSFTSGTGYASTSHSGTLALGYGGTTTRRIDYAGGTYTLSKGLSTSFYQAQYKDVMNLSYFNLNDAYALSDHQSLLGDVTVYRATDAGSANAGGIDMTALSLSLAYTFGAQTVGVSNQQIHGDQPYDYAAIGGESAGVAGGKFSNSIYLANSNYISDFNAPNESSWQVRYALDLAGLGWPGAVTNLKYTRGTGIDGSDTQADSAYYGFYGDGQREHEIDFDLTYVVQSGAAKNFSMRLVQGWHSGAQSTGGRISQTRLILDYPFSFF